MIQGGGLEDGLNKVNLSSEIVHIATFARPFIIDTDSIDVQIGYLDFAVPDIIISENGVAFEDGEYRQQFFNGDRLTIAVGARGRTDLRASDYFHFMPITRDDISVEGRDFRIPQTNTNRAGDHVLIISRGANAVENGVITLTNLELDVHRAIPQGQYDLVIGLDQSARTAANRWIPNYFVPFEENAANQFNVNAIWLYDRFPVMGITLLDENNNPRPYINLVTPGANIAAIQEVII
jgi:hypothetical protein